MAQCTLLYPGLLGPAVPLEELAPSEWPAIPDWPGLSLLIARARRLALPRQALEHQLLTRLGYVISPDAELPVALLRKQADISTVPGHMWCLDPVHVQLDREMAFLAGSETLALTETEARALIASINQHFADEMQVQYHAPLQWLVQIPLQLSTCTPAQATLQDVNRMQPTGQDAPRWRSLLNEIQMLLHAHPVNEARLQAGQPPVNSLWLWGGGRLETTTAEYDVVYAEESLAAAAAVRNAVAHADVPDTIVPDLFTSRNSLLLLTSQLRALQQKDVYAWLAALRSLDQHYLSPLLAMLRQGVLTQLTIYSDSLQLQLDKSRLRRWWLRPQRPDVAMSRLRERYGD